MEPVVVDIHTRSGLLDQARSSNVTVADAAAQTLAFLHLHIEAPRTVPLCGNSIGMDRRFLAAHVTEIEDFLHYRSVDRSTIKEWPAGGIRKSRLPPPARVPATGPSTTSARAPTNSALRAGLVYMACMAIIMFVPRLAAMRGG